MRNEQLIHWLVAVTVACLCIDLRLFPHSSNFSSYSNYGLVVAALSPKEYYNHFGINMFGARNRHYSGPRKCVDLSQQKLTMHNNISLNSFESLSNEGNSSASKKVSSCEFWAVLTVKNHVQAAKVINSFVNKSVQQRCLLAAVASDADAAALKQFDANPRVLLMQLRGGGSAAIINAEHLSRSKFTVYQQVIVRGAKWIMDLSDSVELQRDSLWEDPDKDALPRVVSKDKLTVVEIDTNAALPFNSVYNPYDYFVCSEKTSGCPVWPRGFPVGRMYVDRGPQRAVDMVGSTIHQKPKSSVVELERPFEHNESRGYSIGIVHYLAHGHGDFFLHNSGFLPPVLPSRSLQFTLQKVGEKTLDNFGVVTSTNYAASPYNSKSTLHSYDTFWALLLPTSIPVKLRDVWRGYFAIPLLRMIGKSVAFTSSNGAVRLTKNTEDERQSVGGKYYDQLANALVKFLYAWESPCTQLPEAMEELWIELYERNYIEIQDVHRLQQWLIGLVAMGYRFPPVKYSVGLPYQQTRYPMLTGSNPKNAVRVGHWGEKSSYKIAAVTSYAPFKKRRPRESYKSLLQYWQKDWDIVIKLDVNEPKYESCLMSPENPAPPRMVIGDIAATNETFLKENTHYGKVLKTFYGKNFWKFMLDKDLPDVDIIAVVDDDSCFVSQIPTGDVLNSRHQLVTRSVQIEENHLTYAYRRFVTDVLGWKYYGNFMTDFPVYFWADMLVDVRQYLSAVVARSNSATSDKSKVSAASYNSSSEGDKGWKDVVRQMVETLVSPRNSSQKVLFSEFTILLNFAFNSPKWRNRYHLQTFPRDYNSIVGQSLHQHSDGKCWSPKNPPVIAKHLLRYPHNLQELYNASSNQIKKPPTGTNFYNEKDETVCSFFSESCEEFWSSTEDVHALLISQHHQRRVQAHLRSTGTENFSRVDQSAKVFDYWEKCFTNYL